MFFFCAAAKKEPKKAALLAIAPQPKGALRRGLLKLGTLMSATAAAFIILHKKMCPNGSQSGEGDQCLRRGVGVITIIEMQ